MTTPIPGAGRAARFVAHRGAGLRATQPQRPRRCAVSAAEPGPACPVCGSPIAAARAGRPARYCGTSCRQAAHWAKRRAEAALPQAIWQRRQLTRTVERLVVVAAELVEAEHRLLGVDQGDGEDVGQAAADPVTGWEAHLAELATTLARLASSAAGTARGHAATAADYRQAAALAGRVQQHDQDVPDVRQDVPADGQDVLDVREDVPAGEDVPVGREGSETDVCLVRVEGRWHLYGPDGDLDVLEFGLFGNGIATRDQAGAQEAAVAVVTALTGRTVTGWDRDAWSRSIYGGSTWYACLTD
ncbi:hypothetical protein [Streptosporangium sp. OZ121]|uniref:hypothetical protein n=1 Tax=Streptosporangium sp. OZ121 TaxID=3444183 RepID=UPI003F7B305E